MFWFLFRGASRSVYPDIQPSPCICPSITVLSPYVMRSPLLPSPSIDLPLSSCLRWPLKALTVPFCFDFEVSSLHARRHHVQPSPSARLNAFGSRRFKALVVTTLVQSLSAQPLVYSEIPSHESSPPPKLLFPTPGALHPMSSRFPSLSRPTAAPFRFMSYA